MPRRHGPRLVAATIVIAATMTAAVAAQASASDRPAGTAAATVVGRLAPSTRLTIAVALRARHASALQRLASAQYDPSSPSFHRFLTPAAFTAQFGASSSQLARVTQWLRSVGLAPGSVAANHLAIHATGTAAAIGAALGTSFRVVIDHGARGFTTTVTPTIPRVVAGDVAGVVGLDNLPAVRTHLAWPVAGDTHSGASLATRVAGPAACLSARIAAKAEGSFTAGGMSAYYEMSPLYTLGDLGQGVHVALAEFEPNRASDINGYQSCYGTKATVTYDQVDGGAGVGFGDGEAVLDIETVIGLAPKAAVDVYQAPNSDLGDEDMFNQMVTNDPKVISTSWGECEPETDPGVFTAEMATYQEASVQGEVVFSAAGDDGSTDCGDSNLAVDDPGSEPYVLSVGGTTATSKGESVWNDGSGGGGGGLSVVQCMPSYQYNTAIPGLVNANSLVNATLCPAAPSYVRQVPDVTGIADPATGYTVFYDQNWGAIGGTSGAAPLWAAAAALVVASPYCHAFGSSVGITPQSLYGLAGTAQRTSAFTDITKGNNDVTGLGYTGGLYPARAGFDEASGLGSPILTSRAGAAADLFKPAMASLLCYGSKTLPVAPKVAYVTPKLVASNLPTKVTIVGSGFLPVLGADRVLVDGISAIASCSSTTRCTVTLPGRPPATAPLRLQVQTYATSPVSPGASVTFVKAPTVRSLSPRTGHGGTRVTILGSGFTGTVMVKFGTHAASHVTVVNSGKVVVTAPGGSGTVTVTVTATGGRSATSGSTRFTY